MKYVVYGCEDRGNHEVLILHTSDAKGVFGVGTSLMASLVPKFAMALAALESEAGHPIPVNWGVKVLDHDDTGREIVWMFHCHESYGAAMKDLAETVTTEVCGSFDRDRTRYLVVDVAY